MEKVISLYGQTPSVIPSTPPIIGKSPHLLAVYDTVRRVAQTSASVVVYGETGTGKELVAHAIHAQSERSRGPLVPVNCAAIPADLAVSELFGHERGAFTGATDRQVGKFESASGGTLFLDEVDSLPLKIQATVLRAIQTRQIQRVGGRDLIPVNIRIVAATNQRLEQLVSAGKFRDDLYWRLNIVEIEVPPLRHRHEDIPLLATHFLNKYRKEFGRNIRSISREATHALTQYDWPGNVRELENIIERACALCEGEIINVSDLKMAHIAETPALEAFYIEGGLPRYKQAMSAFEAYYLRRALDENRWNATKTAKSLGLHRNTLMTKIEMLKLREH